MPEEGEAGHRAGGTAADGGRGSKGKGSEWRSANGRHPLQTKTHQGVIPPPPPGRGISAPPDRHPSLPPPRLRPAPFLRTPSPPLHTHRSVGPCVALRPSPISTRGRGSRAPTHTHPPGVATHRPVLRALGTPGVQLGGGGGPMEPPKTEGGGGGSGKRAP